MSKSSPVPENSIVANSILMKRSDDSVLGVPVKARTRLVELDGVKGVAIILVVVGHLADEAPPGNDWYGVLKHGIYLFHMPLFMFISGFLLSYTYRPIHSVREYFASVRRRVYPILPDYLLYGAAAISGKAILIRWLPVSGVADNMWQGLYTVVFMPVASPAQQLWYLYVLLLFVLLTYPMMWLRDISPWVFLALGLILTCVPAPRFMSLHQVCEYIIYVAFGFLAAKYYPRLSANIDRYYSHYCALFLSSLFLPCLSVPFDTAKLVAGTLSIPAVLGFVRLRIPSVTRFLSTVGRYTLVIFLFHAPFLGVSRAMAMQFNLFEGLVFLPLSIILVLGGIGIPIFLKRHVFSRLQLLDSLT